MTGLLVMFGLSAVIALLRAHRQDPAVPQVSVESRRLVALAIGYMRESRWQEAVGAFDQINRAAVPPLMLAELDAHRAYCLVRLERGGDALTWAEEALRGILWSDPHDMRLAVEHTRAVALYQVGRAHEAVGELERIVAADPPEHVQAECWFTLGEALRAVGRDAEAANAWRKATAADPKSEWAQRAQVRLSPGGAYR